jgi:hypothetical protein
MGLIGAWLGSLYHGICRAMSPCLSRAAVPLAQHTSRHRGTISAARPSRSTSAAKRVADADLASIFRVAPCDERLEAVTADTIGRFTARFARTASARGDGAGYGPPRRRSGSRPPRPGGPARDAVSRTRSSATGAGWRGLGNGRRCAVSCGTALPATRCTWSTRPGNRR